MHRDMNAIVLIPRPIDLICQSVWIWVLIAMLFLFQREQIVSRDAFDNVASTRYADRFHDSSDRNRFGLNQGRGGNRVVSWLDLVDAFNET
jgi:hypothetical protein